MMMNVRFAIRARYAIAVGTAGIALALFFTQARADLPSTGQWLLDQHAGRATLDLTFKSAGTDGSHSWDFEDTTSIDRTALHGLTDSQFASNGVHAAFRIVRDAGWFDCAGWVANGRGAGAYRFTPDAAFSQGLATRGIGSPTASQSLRLAIAGINFAYIDRLRALGVSSLSTDDLVRLADHGIDTAYVSAMSADGYRFQSSDDLVRLRDHGVDPQYISAMRVAGYPNLAADDLVRLRDHGVDPGFVASMRAAGYMSISAEDLIRLKDHGVDADFVKRMKAHGYSKLSIDDLIRLRDHGF
jgi:hypothetical protein